MVPKCEVTIEMNSLLVTQTLELPDDILNFRVIHNYTDTINTNRKQKTIT